MKNTFSTFLILVLGLISFRSTAQCNFYLPDFNNYNLVGSALPLSTGGYELTDWNREVGAAWYRDSIDLTYDFDVSFSTKQCNFFSGGYGMVFVLQSCSNGLNALGADSANLGYYGNEAAFTHSLGVEMVISGTEMAITRDGQPAKIAGPVTIVPYLQNCQYRELRLTWNAASQLFSVYFDGNLKLSYSGDLVNDFFGGNPHVYFGFTAATGYWFYADQSFQTNYLQYHPSQPHTSAVTLSFDGGDCSYATLTASPGAQAYMWSNGATTRSISTYPGTFTVTATDPNGCTQSAQYTVYPPPGDPSVFGDNVWNVYTWAYQYHPGLNYAYAGYYIEPNLSFNTEDRWLSKTSPSYTSGYQGCWVNPTGGFTWIAKRRGFDSGYYYINIPELCNSGQLWINGELVWEGGDVYCSGDDHVWTGCLNDSSTVEFMGTALGSAWADDWVKSAIEFVNITAITLNGPSTICPGDTLQLSSPGADSYLWSTGETTQSISVHETGNYSLEMSVEGCVFHIPKSITVAPMDTPAIAFTGLMVCPPNDLLLFIDANERYSSTLWNTGENALHISVVSSGVKSVTVSDVFGCSATSQIVISDPLGDPSIFGEDVWNVYVWFSGDGTAGGGSWTDNYREYYVEPNLSFNTQNRWVSYYTPSDAPGFQGCFIPFDYHSWSAKRRGFPCGNYLISIPDHNDGAQLLVNGVIVWEHIGCCDSHTNVWSGYLDDTSTAEFRVSESTGLSSGSIEFAGVEITANSSTTICPGYTLQLTAGTADSYLWSTGETSQSISVTEAGGYSVDITTDGCTATASTSIAVAAMDTPDLYRNSGFVVCPWFFDALYINDDKRHASILWSTGDTTAYIYPASVGTISVTVSDALGCSATSHVTLTDNNAGTDSTFGNNIWKVNAYVFGIYNYYYDGQYHPTGWAWRPEDYSGYYLDSTLNFNSQSKWSASGSPSDAPGYSGCAVTADRISWSAKRRGFPCGIYQIDILSHDEDAILLIDGVEVWSHYFVGGDSHTNIWTGALNANSTVEFRVNEMYDDNYGALQFTLLDSSNFLTVSGNPITCTGQSYTLTSSLKGAYLWSNGEITNPVYATSSGSYSVTVTDPAGCSFTSDPLNITILEEAAPVAHITSSANTICDWNAVILSSDSATGNLWSTGDSTQSTSVVVGGDYTLTVTNSAGCTSEEIIHLDRSFSAPTPSSSIGLICEGSSVELAASGLAPGGRAASFNGTGHYVSVLQDIPEYDFTVEMWVKTAATDCGIFSVTWNDRLLYLKNGELFVLVGDGGTWGSGVRINDNTWHHIALVTQSGVGQKIYVDGNLAPNSNSYDHSDFIWQTTFDIGYSPDAVEFYFKGEIDNVRIWSEAKTETDIRNNMLLETPLSLNNLIYQCTFDGTVNATIGTNGTTPNGISYVSTDYYTYSWTGPDGSLPSTGETQTIWPSPNSIYSVTASLQGGCLASEEASVSITTISPSPVAHIIAPVSTICNWNAVTLSSDSSSGNFWSNGDTMQSTSITMAGDYILTVTNSGGCTSYDTIHLNSGLTPPAPAASNNGTVCEGSSVELTASGLAPGGQAASFNGIDQYITVTQDVPENDFTIEMWVKTTATDCGIFSVADGVLGSNGMDRLLYLKNGELFGGVYSGPVWGSGVHINDGVWHHIAAVTQSGAGQKIYVDGNLAPKSHTHDHSDFTWQSGFLIGFSTDALQSFFEGQLDNVRIWSEARSASDIRSNMALETPVSTTNLLYADALNGGVNATIGNNGTSPNGISFMNTDYYTYSWTGLNAPASSTSETQTVLSASVSGIYNVTASVGGCSPSAAASTNVEVTPSVSYYTDADGDGYGSSTTSALTSCNNPGAGYVTDHTDCDDADDTKWQNASLYLDADVDSYDAGSTVVCYGATIPSGYAATTNGADCDDGSETAWQVGTFYTDIDADGYDSVPVVLCYGTTVPPEYSTTTNGTDCNDSDGSVWQNASLYIDADADGYDAGSTVVCYGATIPSGYSAATNGADCDDGSETAWQVATFYTDIDGDGYDSGPVVLCYGTTVPPEYSTTTNGTDCNDADGSVWQNVSLYIDADADGYDAGSTVVCYGATIPVGYSATTPGADCNDAAQNIHPGITDLCNDIDDNCNGTVDENEVHAVISPDGNVNACKGTPLILIANTGDGIQYTWYKNGQPISGATSSSYTVKKSGNYHVDESNLICSSASTIASVTVYTLPEAVISYESLDLCETSSVVLMASSGPGFTYQWRKGQNIIAGATNQTYTTTKKGNYKVIVTNAGGCSKTSPVVKVTKSCKIGDENNSEEIIAGALNIYPNPATGIFVVDLSFLRQAQDKLSNEENEEVTIRIYNSIGQLMQQEITTSSGGMVKKEIHLAPKATAGLYLVSVIAGDELFTKQLVIQK